jgi:hypothetical protein
VIQETVLPTETINNNNTRVGGLSTILRMAGTNDNYDYNGTGALNYSALQGTVTVGGGGPVIGNTVVNTTSAINGALLVNDNSTVTNARCFTAIPIALGGNSTITNAHGFVFEGLGFTNNAPSQVSAVFMPGQGPGWINQCNDFAFLRNQDARSFSDVGALRRYSERSNFLAADSGVLTVSRFTGQTQRVLVDDDITEIVFTNYTNLIQDTQFGDPEGLRFDIDTVTFLFTGDGAHTVSLPATNNDGWIFKFANGVDEFATTAGSVHLVTVSLYAESDEQVYGLVTISPEFV